MTSLTNWIIRVWQAVMPQPEATAWEQYKKARTLATEPLITSPAANSHRA